MHRGFISSFVFLVEVISIFLAVFSIPRDFVSISTGTSEYALTNEDVGGRLAFVYSPINFEGRSTTFFVVEDITNMFAHHLDL